MSTSGVELLQRVHGIARDQIDLIPHGIPHVPVDPLSKARLGVDGKTVILTFGLLSPDKGIEYVIGALPRILAAHPEVVAKIETYLKNARTESEPWPLKLPTDRTERARPEEVN